MSSWMGAKILHNGQLSRGVAKLLLGGGSGCVRHASSSAACSRQAARALYRAPVLLAPKLWASGAGSLRSYATVCFTGHLLAATLHLAPGKLCFYNTNKHEAFLLRCVLRV